MVKCLRYHILPLNLLRPWSLTSRKESSSLQVCGRPTVVHDASSNAGASAPFTSFLMYFQSPLKLNVSRLLAGGVNGFSTLSLTPEGPDGIATTLVPWAAA